MTFYIRKGNEVFSGYDGATALWSEITPETTAILVVAYTTRADAQNFLKSLDGLVLCQDFYGAITSNNLDYEL